MGSQEFYEAASLALTVLHDTVGGNHPLMSTLQDALKSGNWERAVAACRAVVALYNEGGLQSPRLVIAHEIEGDILEIAQAQAQAAERSQDFTQKQVQLAIAAFLAGAALEDAMRRLCDAHQIAYDTTDTSIAKLQTALYQPSKGIEVISASDNKQITAWGDTRNNADHGHFDLVTQTGVTTMLMGVRAFIEKHLP